MRDGEARNRLIEAILSYLDDRIGAFELDARLSRIAGETSDATVHFVAGQMWFHYDDCTDHKTVASKLQWDYFQRLLLLLESDAEIEIVRSKRRLWLRVLFLVLVAGLVPFLTWKGLGLTALLILVPMVWAVGAWRRFIAGHTRERDGMAAGLTPFASFGELLRVRRSVPNFSKSRYPAEFAERAIRGLIEEIMLRLSWIAYTMIIPFVDVLWLALLIVPLREQEVRIVFPEAAAA